MIAGVVRGGDQTVAILRSFGHSMPDRVARVVGEFGLDVLAHAKTNVVVKTGRLSRSIHLEMTREPTFVRGTVGTNVEYAGMIEFGFKGAESVRAHLRQITQAWGRQIAPMSVSVRQHSRNVNRPAKPYLRPALAQASPPLSERLAAIRIAA